MGGDVIGYAFCVSSISDLDKLIIRVLSTTLQLNVMLKKELFLTCKLLGETSFLLGNTYWATRYIRRSTLFY